MAFDLVRCFFYCSLKNPFTSSSGLIGVPSTPRGSPNPGGGGVLPYVTLTGTCGPIGYGFQGVLS